MVADLHFAPTEHSRQNLLREGVPDWRIAVTGNPVIDALRQIARPPGPARDARAAARIRWSSPGGRRLVLVTAHRRENFGQPLGRYLPGAAPTWPRRYPDRLQLVYTRCISTPTCRSRSTACWAASPTSPCCRPLDYLPMVHLMKRATLVLTDSGGIQEEATSLGMPALVLREVTERPEGVEAGVLKLVGTDPDTHLSARRAACWTTRPPTRPWPRRANPFGDGHAAERIVAALLKYPER